MRGALASLARALGGLYAVVVVARALRRAAHLLAHGGESPGAAVAALALSSLGSLGFMAAYVWTDSPQLQGAALALALGGLGAGLILWAKRAMPTENVVEPHEPALPERDEQVEFERELAAAVSRRGLAARMLAATAGLFGVAALFPVASLGPAPGRVRHSTAWRPGARLVSVDGTPVRIGDLDVGEVVTVFPEGGRGQPDAQTLLIRLDPDDVRRAGLEATVAGHVAYSKVCTHAGCPVGLYEQESQRLYCPCHQSLFDVLDRARPVAGPATRPLPQLPLYAGADGVLRARSDYTEPVGSGFWRET